MVCPNCGAQLPDTATMCYSCRMKFNKSLPATERHTNELKPTENIPKEPEPKYLDSIEAEIRSHVVGVDDKGRTIVKLWDDRQSYFIISCIAGIIGCCLILFAEFLPFISVTAFNERESLSLLQAESYGVIIDGIILMIYSLPMRKYIKSDGIVKLILGAWGVLLFIYNAINAQIKVNDYIKESGLSNYKSYIEFRYEIGFFMLIFGYILIFISGSMLTYCIPKKCKVTL